MKIGIVSDVHCNHDALRIALDESLLADPASQDANSIDLLALDEALTRLATFDAQQAQVVELRYFGDLSYDELSSELKLNPKTVSSRLSICLDRLETTVRRIFSREKSSVSPSNP
mgnify:CR=1 FL=1